MTSPCVSDDCLSRQGEFICAYTQLASGQVVITTVGQRENRCVLSTGPHVNKLRGLFAQTNRHAVNENKFCAAVTHGLPNLFSGQWLKLFRLASNQDDRFRVADVVMRRERPAKIVKERLDTERIGNGVVFRFDDLGRELSQTIKGLVRQTSTADYAERVITMCRDNRVEVLGCEANRFVPGRGNQLATFL